MGRNSREQGETKESGWKEISIIPILIFLLLFGLAVCWGLYDYQRNEKNWHLVGRWGADPNQRGAPQCILIASNNGRIVFTNGDREYPYDYQNTETSLAFDKTITVAGVKYRIILKLLEGNEKLSCIFIHNNRDSHTVIYHRVREYQTLGRIFPMGKDSPGIVSRLKSGVPNADTRFEVALPANFDLQRDYLISPVSGFVEKIAKTGPGEEQISISPYPPLNSTEGYPGENVYVNLNHIHVVKKIGDFIRKGEPVARVSAQARKIPGLGFNTVSYLVRVGSDPYVDYNPCDMVNSAEFSDKILPQVAQDPKLRRKLIDDLLEPNE